MSVDRPFLDSNILVYAFSNNDPRVTEARRLLLQGGIVSVQVLNELCSVGRRKLHMDWSDLHAALMLVGHYCGEARPLSQTTQMTAFKLARDHGLSIYDACIVASALEAGCTTLYSEDMQHGRQFGQLSICNPFLKTR